MAVSNTGYVIIECPQEIPCNPCADACRSGAIRKRTLNALPELDQAVCTGCKLCVAACPGQAIFYLEEHPDSDTVSVTFPYEYLPLPLTGQRVMAVDAQGKELGAAIVEKVQLTKANNLTPLVTIRMPYLHGLNARSIQRDWEVSQNGRQ